jgi:hypothetical protein
MKNEYGENERIEDVLSRARLPEPSVQLKQRITAEARKAWNQTSADIPWRIPFGRLAASAAAAALVVCLADCSSDYALARWRSVGRLRAELQSAAFDELPEIPYGPFPKRLTSIGRRSPVIDASALSDYIENVRKALDETDDSGVPAPAVQRGGSSRLVPERIKNLSYTWRVITKG